jgi:hypothetical protein
MAKRTRGSNRPGRRAPLQRERRLGRPAEPPARPAQGVAEVVRPVTGLTADEEARAAQIEASIVAEERAAEEATRRARQRSRPYEGAARELGPLSVRAAAEYAYVRRDVLRIARIGGVLLLVLAILHVLINIAGVIRL